MFLTHEELKTLTGYELPGWQLRWLKSHHWKHELAANGRPVVSKAYANSRLSDTEAANDDVTINLAAFKRKA